LIAELVEYFGSQVKYVLLWLGLACKLLYCGKWTRSFF